MDIKFTATIDASAALTVGGLITKEVFPLLNQAVMAVAQQSVINWQKAVYAAPLWSGEKDAYAKSISWSIKGDFSAEVEATYEKASEIEEGRPARDLKKMLGTSLKVRVSKTGSRYLYIPFRHNTPGHGAHAQVMPVDVYKMAKQMAPSRITGKTTRESGTGAYSVKTKKLLTVPQNTYSWGARLPAGLADKKAPHHKTDIYAGMYRFSTGTPGAKSSTYLTFRTMSEKSQGWIIPAKPGLHIAKKVVDDLRPKAMAAFAEAVKRQTKPV